MSRTRRSRLVAAAVLAGYVLVAFGFLGLPLFVERGHRYVGFGYDPQIFIWAFAWWPHAILHGVNPFVTHAVWAPDGLNLAWTTTVPGLALVFWPLTAVAGPIVSYDVAAILMPALAAWTAFLLCRRLVASLWAAIAGGYLFGFSTYVLAQGGEGHLHLSSVFLVPLAGLVVVRFLDGELTGRGLAIRLGPLLGFQVLTATEVAFTVTLALAAGLVLAYLFVPSRRSRVAALLGPLLGAYAIGAALTAPFLYFLLTGFHKGGFNNQDTFVADLANFVVPTKVTLIGGSWAKGLASRFPGNPSEQDAYLGVPTVLAVALFARSRLRAPSGRLVLAAFVLAVVAALGARATIGGRSSVPLPWRLVHSLPLFDNVLTSRLAVYAALAAALAVALWAAARPGPLGWAVPVLCAVALVPDPAAGGFATGYDIAPFFTDAAYRACIDPGENVLPLPVRGGAALLWQAETGFRFTMTGGDISPTIPGDFQAAGFMDAVTDGTKAGPDDVANLRAFIAEKDVTSVIVDPTRAAFWIPALDQIAKPHRVGGVVLYHLRRFPPPCPST